MKVSILNVSLNEEKFDDVVVNKGRIFCCEIPNILSKIRVYFKPEYILQVLKNYELCGIFCHLNLWEQKIQFYLHYEY
jgi:hypothetical protein